METVERKRVHPVPPGSRHIRAGHFKSSPPKRVDPNARRVVYIGETCRSLRQRWQQFQISASSGRDAHAGGSTYHDKFGRVRHNLYVTAFAPDLNKQLRSAYIRYFERKLIWDHVQRWGKRPKCNKD